jgi:hypothetical protein
MVPHRHGADEAGVNGRPVATDTPGMATLAAGVPRSRTIHVAAWPVVGVLAMLAGAAYSLMRVPTALEMQRALLGMCARLEMRPGDWPCEVTTGAALTAFVPASLLIGLGLALPCAVLVARGRRLGAFVPLLVPAGYVAGISLMNEVFVQTATADQSVLGIWRSVLSFGEMRETYWSARPATTALVDAVLIAVPVLAATVFAWRKDRAAAVSRRLPPVGAAPAWLAIAVVGTGIVLANMLWQRVGTASEMATMLGGGESWVPVLVIVSFGMLLGADRRYSPWVFVPIAVLLSAAIPVALTSSLVRMPAFYAFGAVAPLVTMGLIGSAWRPLAEAFGRARGRRADAAGDEGSAERTMRDRGKVRRIVVANALATGVVALSLIAARFDPLPVQISMSLPTYLGQRQQIEDTVARERLAEGLAVVRAFRAEHGTYTGFDADTSTGVRWLRGSYWDHVETGFTPNGRIEIVRAGDSSVQLLTLSQSGRAICAMAGSGDAPATWGQSSVPGSLESRLRTAVAACGHRPLDGSAFRTFPIEDLCPGVDDSSLMVCRAVQKLLRTSLAEA